MFEWLSRLMRYPWLTLLLGCAFSAFSLWLACTRMHFTTDRTQLLDPRAQVQVDWSAYLEEFSRTQDYVLLVRAPEGSGAREATDLLGQSLQQSPYFQQIFYRLELPEVARQGLYFLSLERLRQLKLWLEGGQPWLDLLERQSTPGAVLQALSKTTTEDQLAARMRPLVPLLVATLEGLCDSLESGGRAPFVSPLGPFLADVDMLEGREVEPGATVFYNQLADGKTYMLVAQPSDSSNSLRADIATLLELRQLVGKVRRAHPEVLVMISGEPAINTEEMLGAIQDAVQCAFTAVVVVSTLLIVSLGQLTRALCAVLSLFFGLTWAVGFAALAVGQLNLLTVHFATILTGLGITFSIQFLAHYRLLRSQGLSAELAAIQSLPEARHQAVGAISTAIAFFSLHFTSFRAASELGSITGVGVLLCYLATLTMLPSLLVISEKGKEDVPYFWRGAPIVMLELWVRRQARLVTLLCLAFTLLSAYFAGRIPFDYNLLRMQPRNAEAIRVEGFLSRLGYSTLYAISLAPNRVEAERRIEQFKALSSVSRVESVLALEPNQLAEKEQAVKDLLAVVPRLQLPALPGRLDAFELLEIYTAYLTLKPKLAAATQELRTEPSGPELSEAFQRLDKVLNPGNPGPLSTGMLNYQKAFLKDLETHLQFLQSQTAEPPDILAMVPKEVQMRSLSPSGKVCIRIFPRKDCWERENLAEFLAQLGQVEPHITGIPVLIYSYLEQLRQAYSVSGRNALIVISLLLLLYYRSLSCAALALMPKLLGVVWMLGAMGLLGESFNAANFLALPLTLGIGLIFGIESLRMCRQVGQPMCQQSAGFAVVLSGLTTLLGFSVLMGAQHRGVASFGLVMALGVAMNLLTSLVTLPAFLDLCRLHSLGKGKPECAGNVKPL